MGGRRLIAVLFVLGALGVLVCAGADWQNRGPTRWEYSAFWGDGAWSWYAPGGSIVSVSPMRLAEALDVPYVEDYSALEVRVLNRLGEQGWELVAVTERHKYLFRRPR